MTDATGRTIKFGDLISYPVRQGSSLWVNVGMVTFVGPDYLLVDKVDKEGKERQVRIHNSERVTIALRITEMVDTMRIVARLQPGE